MDANVNFDPREDAYSKPLDKIDVSVPELYQDDIYQPYFERLRREDPVHFCEDSHFGPYWSVTRYKDIMAVAVNHQVFSSHWELGGVRLEDQVKGYERPSFIQMDEPDHGERRKAVSPVVAPGNLARMEGMIRERTNMVLDGLPRGETFDWVKHVSIELTSRMLATLFDWPLEDRHRLMFWSDVTVCHVDTPDAPVHSEAERYAELQKMATAMKALWDERAASNAQRFDLISMMAHADATRNMDFRELLANCSLLIVGGNDTTRNSMSGGVWGLSKFPDEYRKLRDNPELVTSLVSEIIRWHTPVLHLRRTALADFQLGDKTIRKGDKVAMWFVSGNRDEDAIKNPDDLIVDRPRAREHISFGFGVHRCVGNRLAELQLRILWEEILKRGLEIEVMDKPKYLRSNLIHGIRELPVQIH
jgi:cytochrome P450